MNKNDIDLERLRETEIALRFANMGYGKKTCPDCKGMGTDFKATAQARE